ncbi:flavodoxin family protein [Chloroflexota bacterium]
MRILGIVGSPRKDGNTELMVKAALETAKETGAETDLFLISEKNVTACDACDSCLRTGFCHIKDDMQELYQKLEWADGIIFGTPVYFSNVTAQAKAIIDRTFACRKNRTLSGKAVGAVIVTRRLGATQVRSLLYTFFIGQGAIAVGAAVGYALHKGDIVNGIGGSPANLPALEEARNLARDIMQMVKRLPQP